MMIVMPTLSESQKPYPPDIDAVVVGGEIFIAKLGDVANQVEHKRYL